MSEKYKLDEPQEGSDSPDLHRAVSKIHTARVRGLLDAGADPKCHDAAGRIALDVAQSLLMEPGIMGNKPLCSEIWSIIRMLRKRVPKTQGAVRTLPSSLIEAVKRNASGISVLRHADKESINRRDENGMTALMWAVKLGRSDVVKSLLSRGADVKIKDGKSSDENRRRALDYAHEAFAARGYKSAPRGAKRDPGADPAGIVLALLKAGAPQPKAKDIPPELAHVYAEANKGPKVRQRAPSRRTLPAKVEVKPERLEAAPMIRLTAKAKQRQKA
jgi:hypothetical protein